MSKAFSLCITAISLVFAILAQSVVLASTGSDAASRGCKHMQQTASAAVKLLGEDSCIVFSFIEQWAEATTDAVSEPRLGVAIPSRSHFQKTDFKVALSPVELLTVIGMMDSVRYRADPKRFHTTFLRLWGDGKSLSPIEAQAFDDFAGRIDVLTKDFEHTFRQVLATTQISGPFESCVRHSATRQGNQSWAELNQLAEYHGWSTSPADNKSHLECKEALSALASLSGLSKTAVLASLPSLARALQKTSLTDDDPVFQRDDRWSFVMKPFSVWRLGLVRLGSPAALEEFAVSLQAIADLLERESVQGESTLLFNSLLLPLAAEAMLANNLWGKDIGLPFIIPHLAQGYEEAAKKTGCKSWGTCGLEQDKAFGAEFSSWLDRTKQPTMFVIKFTIDQAMNKAVTRGGLGVHSLASSGNKLFAEADLLRWQKVCRGLLVVKCLEMEHIFGVHRKSSEEQCGDAAINRLAAIAGLGSAMAHARLVVVYSGGVCNRRNEQFAKAHLDRLSNFPTLQLHLSKQIDRQTNWSEMLEAFNAGSEFADFAIKAFKLLKR